MRIELHSEFNSYGPAAQLTALASSAWGVLCATCMNSCVHLCAQKQPRHLAVPLWYAVIALFWEDKVEEEKDSTTLTLDCTSSKSKPCWQGKARQICSFANRTRCHQDLPVSSISPHDLAAHSSPSTSPLVGAKLSSAHRYPKAQISLLPAPALGAIL